jgi:hypothetical protein
MSLGVGLDIGTMNIVAARKRENKVETTRVRDAFLDVPVSAKKMLKLSQVPYVERDEELLLVGDTALDMANIFGREIRRPLQDGLISPSEIDSVEVLGFLLQSVVGPPAEEKEYIYYSIPAAPLDQPDRDVVYHKGIFYNVLAELGFNPVASNEAMAIIYSECAREAFTGLAFSFGSGMTNVAMAFNTLECLTFSMARGGDWIDKGASKNLGSTAARLCTIKESGFNLMNPTSREQEALAFYYRELIEYSLKNVVGEFVKIRDKFAINKPMPIIISGGTSLAEGFLPFFQEVFERHRKKFPIEISEIRVAEDQLNAVAKGLLVQAMQEYV